MSFPRPRRTACAVALVFLAAPAALSPQRGGSVTRETGEGLHTARLETPRGSIQVYLPDDLAAGDTISGTVSYTPAGRTEAEREENLGELQGYVVEVAEEPVADGPTWTRVLPELPGPTVVRFRAPRGTPVGEAPIPTAGPVEPAPPGLGEMPPTFEIPTFGQAGHPVAVGGPFSGDPAATAITIGGNEAPFLAQSPRQTIARVPTEVVGPTDVRVEQDGEVVEVPFRVLAVSLAADKLNLQRGERTRLHLEVSGLEGLDEPIPLTLTNRSPQVIRLGEGEVEHLTIQPEEVAPGGTYRLERPIESLRAGGFAINAVAEGDRRTSAPTLIQARSPGCPCRLIKVSGDDKKKPTADRKKKPDNTQNTVTVKVPITADIWCQGPRGKDGCAGEIKLQGASADRWTVTFLDPRKKRGVGDILPERVVDGTVVTKTLSPASWKPSAKCEERTAAPTGEVEIHVDLPKELELPKLPPAQGSEQVKVDILSFKGKLILTFRSTCELQGPATTSITVDLGQAGPKDGKSSPVMIYPDTSDLNGDGSEDFHDRPVEACACTNIEAVLKPAAKQDNIRDDRGKRRITLRFDYDVTTTCNNPSRSEFKCAGKYRVELARPRPNGPGWQEGDDRARPEKDTLSPSEIQCLGDCSKGDEQKKGTLTYKATLLEGGTGEIEIKLVPLDCEGAQEKSFRFTVDATPEPGRPPIVRVPEIASPAEQPGGQDGR